MADEDGDPGAAVLVDAGAFRIDRKRTLDKLMRYQLPDPAMYVLTLVRCAVAGGASRVSFQRLEAASGGVEVRFDGKPFAAAELEYPYAALFKGTQKEGRRGRELALALLSLLRLEPKRVTVLSGAKQGRILLQIESLESESIAPAEDNGTLTVLRALPRLGGKTLWNAHSADLLRDHCRQCPIPILVDGKEVFRGIPQERRICPIPVDADGVRGWIDVPYGLWTRSDVSTAWYGVSAGAIQEALSAVQVVGELNDDRFQPNASQTLIVRNAEYRRVMALLSRNADQLLRNAIEVQNRRSDVVCGALDVAPLRQHWTRQLELAAGRRESGLFSRLARLIGDLAIPPEWADSAVAMELDVRRTLWLRGAACRLLSSRQKDRKDELRQALWDARLLVSADLKSLSLADLVQQKEVMGYIPYATEPFPGLEMSFCSVWRTHPAELDFAAALLGRELVDVTPLLEKAARDRSLGPSLSHRAPVLEQIGITDLALRLPFAEDDFSGEVGLRFSRGGANTHLFQRGLPVSYAASPRPLRFAAVAAGTSDLEAAAAAVMKAVPALYERAAEVFSPLARSNESRALRAHLIDFLEWSCAEAKGKLPAERRWLAQTLLFPERTQGGAWSHEKMREAVGSGEQLFFSRQAESGFTASRVFEDGRFSAEFLQRLFPDFGVSAFPGKADLWMVNQKGPAGCAHGAAGGCLAEWSLEGAAAHLALGGGEGGWELRQSWGSLWVFGPSAPVRTVPDEAGLALLTALVRECGTFYDRPQDPLRLVLLRALRYFFAAPWKSPAAGSLPHRRFHELVWRLPFFRGPQGGRSLLEVETVLTRERLLVYRKPDDAGDGRRDRVLLDDEELALLSALWPAGRFQPEQSSEGSSPSAQPAPPAPPPAPPASVVVGFGEAMLHESELSLGGLRARIGLAKEPKPGLSVQLASGEGPRRFLIDPRELKLSGKVLLDASGYAGPLREGGALHPDVARAVLVLYFRFLWDLLAGWPALPGELRSSGGIQEALLFLLQPVPAGAAKPPAAWEDLRRRIRSLDLFPTSDGGATSLDFLARRLATGEPLRYLKRLPFQVEPGSGFFPVMLHPMLVSEALGGAPLTELSPQNVAASAPPPAPVRSGAPRPVTPAERVAAEVLDLFKSLRGRRGVDRAGCPSEEGLRLGSAEGGELYSVEPSARWEVNLRHPLVRAVLDSALPAETQAAYLASLVYTEANRRMDSITDAEDACFQSVLADELCRRARS